MSRRSAASGKSAESRRRPRAGRAASKRAGANVVMLKELPAALEWIGGVQGYVS